MKPYRISCAVAFAAAVLAPHFAHADTYPVRPIRIIVPFSPGATTDVVGRMLSQKLNEAWGQPVVVENRPGAGGTVGGAYAAKATPDGYTLFIGSVGSIGTSSGLYKNLAYDPIKDFAPVTLAVQSASVLVIHPSLGANTVKELIAVLKTRDGQTNYWSAGNGSPSHLAVELFKSMAGVKAAHVPYKGPSDAINDFIAGQTQFTISSAPSTIPLLKLGRAKALASTGRARLPELPDLPTMIESGLPGYEVYVWYGVMAPAGTPRVVVAKLNGELNRILNLPEIKSRLAAQGNEVVAGTPEAFLAFIKAEVAKWNKVIRESGASIN